MGGRDSKMITLLPGQMAKNQSASTSDIMSLGTRKEGTEHVLSCIRCSLNGTLSVALFKCFVALQVSNPSRIASMAGHNGPLLDLSHATPDIITKILGNMSLRERFICALVCKAWAEAATAATHSIVLEHSIQDLSGLQTWLEKHGNQVTTLQLHECNRAAVTALPCRAKLQDLLLHNVSIASRTWGDIAAATKLTSISLDSVQTASQQADVVAALTALPNLEQLTWCSVQCSDSDSRQNLSDSSLLQQITRLTSLDLQWITAAALQHLGSLTKLQHLSISVTGEWHAAGCPGLQELTALTSLKLDRKYLGWRDLPAVVSQLTALQQLDVATATHTALNQLQVLTGLTQLCVGVTTGLSPQLPPLKLPALQHLEVSGDKYGYMPMSFLASCTRLQFLNLHGYNFEGPGSLLASTMLQHLELVSCSVFELDIAADAVPWQQDFRQRVFPGPGQLPHLTYLQLWPDVPATVQQADINSMVERCSNLQVLGLDTLRDSFAPALARLPGLTSLRLSGGSAHDCRALAQLTGLRQLTVDMPKDLSAVGLRRLAAAHQLTSLGFGWFSHSAANTWAGHFMKDNLPGYDYAIINKVNAEFTTTPCQSYGCSTAGHNLGRGGGG